MSDHEHSSPPDDEFDPDGGIEEAIESDDPSSFIADIHEYPLYREMSALLDQHGYPPNDPLRLFLEIITGYHRDARTLSNRNVHLHAAQAQQLTDLQAEIMNVAASADRCSEKMDTVEPKMQAFHAQTENLLKAMLEAVPAMVKIQGEMKATVTLLESKTMRSIAILMSIGAIVYCAGFITALSFK